MTRPDDLHNRWWHQAGAAAALCEHRPPHLDRTRLEAIAAAFDHGIDLLGAYGGDTAAAWGGLERELTEQMRRTPADDERRTVYAAMAAEVRAIGAGGGVQSSIDTLYRWWQTCAATEAGIAAAASTTDEYNRAELAAGAYRQGCRLLETTTDLHQALAFIDQHRQQLHYPVVRDPWDVLLHDLAVTAEAQRLASHTR